MVSAGLPMKYARILSTPAQRMRALILVTPIILLAGCSGAQISIGGGSFGGSGGIGGSVTTEVPVLGGDDSAALPIVQVPLNDAVIAAVFPDKTLPFTADADDAEALAQYVDNGTKPALSDDTKNKLDQCVAAEARCRIRLQE
jgi:hypothetical protein